MMKSFMRIIVEELWCVDPQTCQIDHVKVEDTVDGFYVNEDGDLLMRRIGCELKRFYPQPFWFRKETYAKDKVGSMERENG